ncbi:efflux transporter outer membrane subunit [Methylosinus sporium]|uniref:efflux transporter outer membrane subunit n=1 Tax=Methylosinus sporium TaxID=428 RepID=UPI003839EC2C
MSPSNLEFSHWTIVTARLCRLSLGSSVLMFLSGCAVGPDFQPPSAPSVSSFLPTAHDDRAGSAPLDGLKLVSGAEIPAQWWELLRSDGLNQLVREAIAHNSDLTAAEAAVRVARANALAQRGALFPSVDAMLDANRQKIAVAPTVDPNTGEASTGPSRYSVVTRQVSVSFAPDIWGGTRRQIESADAEVELQAFQREGVYLTLASNVALAAIEEARLRGQIDATNRVIALQTKLLSILRRQFEIGHIASSDVMTQETALAQSRLALPPLVQSLATQRHLLAFLTGRFPADPPSPTFRLAAFGLPRALPLSVPGDLIRQRPDVRAAEASLHEANAQIGAAIADRLPQITLSANIGKTSSNAPDLSPSGAIWQVGSHLAQKVFDAGTLAYKQRAAEEGASRSFAQYRSVVLAAFQNVADALSALRSDSQAIAAATAAESSARRNVELIQRQLEQGLVNVPIVIEAQRAYLDTTTALVDARASRFADTVALFQALGGGWWNRRDAKSHAAAESL